MEGKEVYLKWHMGALKCTVKPALSSNWLEVPPAFSTTLSKVPMQVTFVLLHHRASRWSKWDTN